MRQEADREIERHPGQVEERRRPDARQEGAHLSRSRSGCRPSAPVRRLSGRRDDDVEDRAATALVERRADPGQDARADEIEHALEAEQDS